MNLDKYSIITVVYNGAELIEDTIKSVIEQDYSNIEYIIIDGGSSDNTVNIIRNYEDYITYYISEPDNGVFDAMNKGIRIGTGTWFNFMNAGDTFSSCSVISQFAERADPNYAFLYGSWKNNGSLTYPVSEKNMLFGGIMACHQAMFFNKFVLNDELYYTNKFKLFCEYDLVARIIAKGFLYDYCSVEVANYLGGGISSKISWHARRAKYLLVYKHYGLKGICYSILGRLGIWSYPKAMY